MESYNNLMSDIMDEMDPRVLEFIKSHVTTFTRWDTIRFFHENPNTQDTAENLARYVGRSPAVIRQEAQEMAEEGIFRSVKQGKHTVYLLTNDPDRRRLIANLVEAARDRTFRMKLVYHILRAGGQQ
jgi:DNA recombination-dependent growth factor C